MFEPRVVSVCKAIFAPALCLALLGGISVEQHRHVPPANVAGYHAAVKDAIDNGVPYQIDGRWNGKDVAIPESAQQLLRLNAFVSRHYTDNSSAGRRRDADFLIVQSSDSSDMDGHWPPNCYPAIGQKLEFQQPLTFVVNGVTLNVEEYHFLENSAGHTDRHCVYHFLIIPNVGTTRDMRDVRAAAADYRERFLGAAQVQVVMDGNLPQNEREQIFNDLIAPVTGVIKAITSGGHS